MTNIFSDIAEAIVKTIRKISVSVYFYLVMLCFSFFVVIFDLQSEGTAVFILILCLFLIVCEDITATTLPLLFLCVFDCMCYNSFDQFIKLWWLAIPAVIALVFHFVWYRKKIITGESFTGLLAVTVAVTLGGLFFIPPSEYFSVWSLYYVFGLGAGMVMIYILIKSQIGDKNSEDMKTRFAIMLYLMGILAAFCVIIQYLRIWDDFIENPVVISTLISRNNFASYMMFALPCVFYFALKNPVHLLSAIVMYASLILTGSRGGMLFGTVELFMCVVFFIVYARKNVICNIARGIIVIGLVICAVTAIVNLDELLEFCNPRYNDKITNEHDTRYVFLTHLKDNFLSNPIFGQGLGYQGNQYIYESNKIKGTMCWYHMMIPQIIGSMGIVGILCYGYQIVRRMFMIVKRMSAYVMAIGLSYIGIFMMSQVNPGEFCPLPYEFLVVFIFIIIENEKERFTLSGIIEKHKEKQKSTNP